MLSNASQKEQDGAVTIGCVNIGIVGLGFMGVTHLTTWRKLPGATLTAIAGRGGPAFQGDFSRVGGNLGTSFASVDLTAVAKYRDWRALLADPAVEAVDICLPTDAHETVAVAALAAGKHVLCEKPMALDPSSCKRMLAAAAAADRVLMIGHVLRFFPAYRLLREMVQQHRYSAVRSATFTRLCGLPDWSSWLPDERRSGGAILDLLIHDLDQILLLFGPPRGVRAKSLGPVDGLSASLLYEGLYGGGPEIRLQGGWMAPETPFSMSFQLVAQQAQQAQVEFDTRGMTVGDTAGRQTLIDLDGADPFQAQLQYFLDCATANRPPVFCPPEQSAQAVQLAHYLKQSRNADGEEIPCEW